MNNAIEIKNFSFGYHDSPNTLTDISLTVPHGQRLALIGPNGAGKSTLLLAINMFVKGKGSIKVDGLEANKANAKKIRTTLGSVLQNPDEQLFMPTIFDDVAFGPLNMGLAPDEVKQRTMDALKTVGLAGMEKRPPYHLSAGQKRAAAIATVLSMNPRILTMDEPDTSLDPRSRNHLIDLLKSLDQTQIIATCSMDFAAALCDRAIVIDEGKIVADGPTQQIMSDTNLMQTHGLETPRNTYP